MVLEIETKLTVTAACDEPEIYIHRLCGTPRKNLTGGHCKETQSLLEQENSAWQEKSNFQAKGIVCAKHAHPTCQTGTGERSRALRARGPALLERRICKACSSR